MPNSKDGERTLRPFPAVLQDIAHGALVERLTTAYGDLALAVVETGKPGTLTVTLKIEHLKEASDPNILTITADCTLKLPTEKQVSILYADDAGNLTRNDPRRPTLPVRGVSSIGETA